MLENNGHDPLLYGSSVVGSLTYGPRGPLDPHISDWIRYVRELLPKITQEAMKFPR